MTLFVLFSSLAVATALAAPPSADEVVLDMAQASKRSDRKRLATLLPRAHGHLLEPWAAYWELRTRLEEASPAEIQEFLQRWSGTYQEDRLRADWLLLLGQRRDWEHFDAEYPHYRMQDERELRCYALASPATPVDAGSAQEVLRLWLLQKDADEGCLLAATRLVQVRLLSPPMLWRKVVAALSLNQLRAARATLELLGPDAAANLDDALTRPTRVLHRKPASGERGRATGLVALLRLASQDPDGTAQQMQQGWSERLTVEQRSWVWAAVGRLRQQRLDPEAWNAFSRTRDVDLDDDALIWKLRAALRQGQWGAVLSASRAISTPDPAWTYWQARSLMELDATANADAARALWQGMAGWRGFYEQLSAADLGQQLVAPTEPPAPAAEEQRVAREHPGIQRALAAIALGLRPEGVREWNYTTNLHQRGGMGERELLAVAELACQREVWDRCISASERTRGAVSFRQRYPTPLRERVMTQSARAGLDPAFVYGLVRQESRFVMDARSSAGAGGLMQLMPATARWTAHKIGMEHYRSQSLTDPDVNLALGTAYLKAVLDDSDGSLALAAAAYNAGPSRSRSWRARSGPTGLETAIWAETIPFTETRDYVKRVLANTTAYAALLNAQPQTLRTRLGRIAPRQVSTAAAPDLP